MVPCGRTRRVSDSPLPPRYAPARDARPTAATAAAATTAAAAAPARHPAEAHRAALTAAERPAPAAPLADHRCPASSAGFYMGAGRIFWNDAALRHGLGTV